MRAYLVGRLSRSGRDGASEARKHHLHVPPVLCWWLFDGCRYDLLDGFLGQSWAMVAQRVQRLLATFSPRWRELERPEGRVDWARTIQRRTGSGTGVYVCETSAIGLSDDERRAVLAWCAWISGLWHRYLDGVGAGERSATSGLERLAGHRGTLSDAPALRRWAHVLRRSRWPLLRTVMAETLRAALEPTVLDRLPLPSARETLFELACLVRSLSLLHPEPADIAWLLPETSNQIRLPGITAAIERHVEARVLRDDTLEDRSLGAALHAFGVKLPSRSDVVLEFAPPQSGFDTLLIEAKSGEQSHSAAVHQLRTYARALLADGRKRILAVAVTEAAPPVTGAQLAWLARQVVGPSRIVWAFADLGGLAAVIDAALVATAKAPPDGATHRVRVSNRSDPHTQAS